MSEQEYNLDDGVIEYTPFTLLGHKYKFRQFNTDEAAEMQKISADDKETLGTYYEKFIIPVDDSPPFSEIKGKMLMAHWKNFNSMVYAILDINPEDIKKKLNENKGTESTTTTA